MFALTREGGLGFFLLFLLSPSSFLFNLVLRLRQLFCCAFEASFQLSGVGNQFALSFVV